MPSTPDAFSPLLLLGLALRPVPASLALAAARPILAEAARHLTPLLRDRLDGLSGTVAVLPDDFPYGVLLRIAEDGVHMEPLASERVPPPVDACLRAPAAVLLDLAAGCGRDGDASFFSRALVVEGDTALVMALRYALEDAAEAGLESFALIVATLPPPLRPGAAQALRTLACAAEDDARRVQAALLAPLRTWQARTDARLSALEERVDQVGKRAHTCARKDRHAAHA